MPIIDTSTLTPQTALGQNETLQVYCGLDSCVTFEVRDELIAEHGSPPAIYNFQRALMGPYLEIMQRGFRVDELSRRREAQALNDRKSHLENVLNQMAIPIWGKELNPRSPTQLKDFFYHELKLPEVWLSQKGERKLSTNREALEKLEEYLYARPFCATIMAIRDIEKQLDVLEGEIDADGRFRTSYNIAGTEGGRPSSSASAFGTGGNAQNIAPSLRHVFIADPGYRLAQIDLEQVEARDVGFICGCLFNDWTYLDTLENDDVHSFVARMIFPNLPWTGDKARDKVMCDSIMYYRDFSHRYICKRGSHLSNYMGTAWTAARVMKVPLATMEMFQAKYCRGGFHQGREIEPIFPAIPRWWQWTAEQIQTKHVLFNLFERHRHFFGRPNDDATIREGIAFQPQSTTADRMNLGLYRVWKKMSQVQLLAQGFDSITFQYRESLDENEIIGEALEHIKVELRAKNGRSYIVPGEAKVGWNWGTQVIQADVEKAKMKGLKRIPQLNLDGLIKWNPNKRDARVRQVGLQRIMA